MISRKTEVDIILNHYTKELKEFNYCYNHYRKHDDNNETEYYLLKIQETKKIIKHYEKIKNSRKEFNYKKPSLEEKIIDLIKSYGGVPHEQIL